MTRRRVCFLRSVPVATPLLFVAAAVALVLTGRMSVVGGWELFVWATALTGYGFIGTWSVMSHFRWIKSEDSRNIASVVGAITVVATYAVSVLALGTEYVNRDWFRLGTWATVWLVLARLSILMVRRQLQGRREKERER
jgi:hypothetical protein